MNAFSIYGIEIGFSFQLTAHSFVNFVPEFVEFSPSRLSFGNLIIGNPTSTSELKKVLEEISDIRQGTIPILRKQRDWVGGVRKMEIFADVQYYLY